MAQAPHPPADPGGMISTGRNSGRGRAIGGAIALMLVSAVAAAGCSRGDAAPRGFVVNVHERDFKLSASTEKVRAGLVTFRVHNTGPSTHEFIVDRTDVPADALPLRANGISVNEEAKQLRDVGEMGGVRLGETRELTLTLKPGRYAVFCNLEGHYRGGMYATVEVMP